MAGLGQTVSLGSGVDLVNEQLHFHLKIKNLNRLVVWDLTALSDSISVYIDRREKKRPNNPHLLHAR